VGRPLSDVALEALDVQVVSVRRAQGAVVRPDPELPLQGEDTLVLSGLPEALARAEARLLSG
jgi:CPA2 family monovalent cation:H+ antiporter-2